MKLDIVEKVRHRGKIIQLAYMLQTHLENITQLHRKLLLTCHYYFLLKGLNMPRKLVSSQAFYAVICDISKRNKKRRIFLNLCIGQNNLFPRKNITLRSLKYKYISMISSVEPPDHT